MIKVITTNEATWDLNEMFNSKGLCTIDYSFENYTLQIFGINYTKNNDEFKEALQKYVMWEKLKL